MKIPFRIPSIAIIPALILLLTVPFAPIAGAQNAKYDALFAPTRSLETTQPDKAYQEYQRLKNEQDGKDKEAAADALLRAGLFASDAGRWASTGQFAIPDKSHLSAEQATEFQSRQGEGEQKAHEAIKQLLQQYPDTQAAARAKDAHWVNGGDTKGADVATTAFDANALNGKPLREALEDRIDHRNAHGFGYRLLDRMVQMTGNKSALSYWLALALIALLVKTITLPVMLRAYKGQREMQRIQPLMKEINDRYKGKPEYQEKVMAAYKEHGVNPFASCLPALIPLPFTFWVFATIRAYEYHFANGKFLWVGSSLHNVFPSLIAGNLAQFDMPLLVLYAASNYMTMKLTPATDPAMAQQQKATTIMMTGTMFMMFWISRWSAAFIFYWLILNIISAWQQYNYIYKPNKNNPVVPITTSPLLANAGGGANGGGLVKAIAAANRNNTGRNGSSSARTVQPSTPKPRPKSRKRK